MEGKGQSSRPKRPLPDDDSDPSPLQRRARFPKAKKAKKGNELSFGGDGDEEDFQPRFDAQLAAKERAKRRSQLREEELFRDQVDISSAEVHYEDDANFEEDGIRIEPFNLKQEREEGYFDENGNFVEYASQHDIKDAWLDNVEVDTRFAKKHQEKVSAEEDYQDLSSEDIGKIKRNIANLLQPGETIIQALKRLKGTSSDNRGKMSLDAKHMFDQLTEYAMKLMENGEYNAYHEERETFEREAEGYERVARAKNGTLESADIGNSDAKNREDIFSDGMGHATHNSLIWDMEPGPSEANASTLLVSSNDAGDKFDMFADDDENGDENLRFDGSAVGSGSTSEPVLQPTSGSLDSNDLDSAAADGGLRSDYVYDPSSGYYYSSSLGYYYDPASGLYCCAASGTWYSFDEQTGAYNEVQNVASVEN
ncbi:LIN1-like protein isoform X2 [Phoenix dactylifera]|uniref:LIN1-like protein isoform X2 n=1 Tax=Phoenix dactylifera TaxID=42345 RepID=A0A8B7C3C4_PHODC|nr:LIN1-like protein isoform X2 [Phoenix dactylifera]